MSSKLFARHQGLLDVTRLLGKTACFFGLGTVGSQAALWLAKSGVGRFHLVDPERIDEENVCRHLAGIGDIGKTKVKVVADAIHAKNPDALVRMFPTDVTGLSPAEEDEVFAGVDLVIASTDSNLAQFVVNSLAVARRLPALYVGVYEQGAGGEIVYVIPGRTACFSCAFESRAKSLKPRAEPGPTRAYTLAQTEAEADRLEAEPGLAVDIDLVTASAMPYALALIDEGSARSFLINEEKNVIFVSTGSKPSWIFERPFSRIVAKPDKGCALCRPGSEFQHGTDARAEDSL